jgi:hypothetical protein
MDVTRVSAASMAAREVERTTIAMAKVLRIQRQQADATVVLIEQAAATPPGHTGRLIDVRA